MPELRIDTDMFKMSICKCTTFCLSIHQKIIYLIILRNFSIIKAKTLDFLTNISNRKTEYWILVLFIH